MEKVKGYLSNKLLENINKKSIFMKLLLHLVTSKICSLTDVVNFFVALPAAELEEISMTCHNSYFNVKSFPLPKIFLLMIAKNVPI